MKGFMNANYASKSKLDELTGMEVVILLILEKKMQ